MHLRSAKRLEDKGGMSLGFASGLTYRRTQEPRHDVKSRVSGLALPVPYPSVYPAQLYSNVGWQKKFDSYDGVRDARHGETPSDATDNIHILAKANTRRTV